MKVRTAARPEVTRNNSSWAEMWDAALPPGLGDGVGVLVEALVQPESLRIG